MSFWWDLLYFDAAGWPRRVFLYWVDTCGLVGHLFGGVLVRVTRALGLDSGNLC